jgi:putative transposase
LPQYPYSRSVGNFKDLVEQTLGWTVDVVKRPLALGLGQGGSGAAPGAHRLPGVAALWVVERTFGWLGGWRRTSKDYEYLPVTSECAIYLTMIRVMLRRLAECQ